MRALTKSYARGASREATALKDLDLDVSPRRLVALVGANGAGKTTLLRLLAGDLTRDAGEARVLGEDPADRSSRLRARVAYVSQALALDPEMTARETLRLFSALAGTPRPGRNDRLLEGARAFGLEEHLEKRVARLSGGLKRRLHLAIAFLGDPWVLLLDEPTAGLDADGQKHLWKVLEGHRSSGGCALVATHDLDEAERHADEIVHLERGRLVKSRRR
ncbi:MAG TPA: ABC transporter ATP-binding protein [Thermoanaerobaculia bacterium]|nr:ABC transporter ATP-binding protein [Thermoanaerobaculia bacterium]